MTPIHNTINITNSSFSGNVLKNGDSVYVRILNTTENPNKYIASFAGNLFEVTSKEKLLPGTEFRATIKLNGKTLQLIPQKNIEKTQPENSIQKFDIKSFDENSTQINNLLQSLNLPQDKLSFNLIQFFQQHQIKLNIPLIKKSRAKSKNAITKNKNLMKFEKIQENLAELDLSMELKGFSLSEEELINLLQNFTQGKIFNLSNNLQKENENQQNKKDENTDFSFLSKIYTQNDILETQKNGSLTLFNHIITDKSNLHWIVLPFEFTIRDILYFGTIRLLLNRDEKKLQKTYISCSNQHTKYYFMVYYESEGTNKTTHINYFVEPSKQKSDIELLRTIFNDNKQIKIEFSEDAKNSNLFTEDIPIICSEVNV